MQRPNIVLIHTHDTGRHLGCYGAGVPTPNLSRLAGEGVLFRQAFCASPSCSASRASLMTSLYSHQNGMMGLCHRGFRLNDPRQHLSHLLRNAGYLTKLIGVQHEIQPNDIGLLGYDEVLDNSKLKLHSAERGEIAAQWLRSAPRRPFFLNVGCYETHRKFLPAEPPDDPRFIAPLPWLPDDPRVRADIAELHTAVRHVDDCVGIILNALEEGRLLDDTLVIFTTDHGVPFPRAKSTLFDAGIGVALLMRGPGGFTGGKVVDSMVSHVDLLPSMLELAGLSPPAYAQGKSLLPLVRGNAGSAREEVFAEITYHAAYDPCRCIRTERHKLIQFFEDRPHFVLANIDDSPTKEVLRVAGLPRGNRPRTQLFDLVADPQEFENLADDPAHAAIRAGLDGRLRAWMLATDDPLLRGPVPLPPGGIVTPHTAYSPTDR